ncbi:MAG: hypothetical protein ACE5E6_01005 [Phycisphaerae bacterium]
MSPLGSRRVVVGCFAEGVLCALAALCAPAYAQRAVDPAIAPVLDRRKVPQALSLDTPSLGLFQNDVQRSVFQQYHTTPLDFADAALSTDNTLGTGLSRLPGFGRGVAGTTGTTFGTGLPLLPGFGQNVGQVPGVGGDPYAFATSTTFGNRGLSMGYGGFRPRRDANRPGDLRSILTRRFDLLGATATTAPLRGALLRMRGTRLPATLGSPAAGLTDVLLPAEPQHSLIDHLRYDIKRSYAASRAEGWSWLASGRYRRALRSFESATTIQARDFESHIGGVFCRALLGQFRSAGVALEALAQRDVNPFAHDVDVRGRLASPDVADGLRTQMQVYGQRHAGDRGFRALHAFVLWYLGERDLALRMVAGASGGAGVVGGPQAPSPDWSGLMAAASATPEAARDAP